MASETSIENQSSFAWKPGAGSLQAMNLGSVPLGQLGQLVNWRNEQTYTAPACNPWVDLPLAETVPGNASAPIASAPVEPTKPAEIISSESTSTPIAPPEVAAEATSLNAQANDAALEAAKAQELAEATAKAMASAAEEAAAKAKAAADQEAAEAAEAAARAANKAAKEATEAKEAAAREATEKEAREATARELAAKEAAAKEAAAKEAAAKEAAAREAADREASAKEAAAREAVALENAAKEAAAKQIAETKAADSTLIEPAAPSPLSEPIATRESAAEPISNPPKVPNAAKETKSAVAPKTNSSAASKTESNRSSENQPAQGRSEPLSLHINDIIPIVPSNLRSLRSESSSDDYLLQLERLVLELNMELGRSRGEPKPVDPLEQMANRIIALNLENLALREKLQRTLNAS